MNKELILKSDVLDIVFDNRNKAYGAYDLRKFYNNRLVKSLGLMLIGVVVLSAFTFLPKKKAVKPEDIFETTTFALPPDTKKEEPKKEEPKKEPVKTQTPPTQAYNKPVVAIDIEVKEPVDNLKDTIAIGGVDIKGKPGDIAVINVPIVPVVPEPIGDPVTEPVVDTKTPIPFAEVMPSYPGGNEALLKFLRKNLQNPRDMEEGEVISVKVRFVVNYDGKLQSFVTVQDGGEEFNREVMRVLKKMPEWVPGKTKGQNVSVYYTIPVKFVTE